MGEDSVEWWCVQQQQGEGDAAEAEEEGLEGAEDEEEGMARMQRRLERMLAASDGAERPDGAPLVADEERIEVRDPRGTMRPRRHRAEHRPGWAATCLCACMRAVAVATACRR